MAVYETVWGAKVKKIFGGEMNYYSYLCLGRVSRRCTLEKGGECSQCPWAKADIVRFRNQGANR
jgi:hypothetical protein